MGINCQLRVGVEWINNYSYGICAGLANLSHKDCRAEGFYNEMGNNGHVKAFDWGEHNAWETDFRHPDFGGDSLNWSDNVHFCYLSCHGGNSDNNMYSYFAVAHDKCYSPSNEWRLGTKMMKWFVVDACAAVLNTDPAHILAVWGGPMQGVHIVFGFIGEAMDSWWTDDLGEDFAEDACDGDSLAKAWVDDAYSWWQGDKSIAIAAGTTQADAINRRENETLNWSDSDIAFTGWLAWKWRD